MLFNHLEDLFKVVPRAGYDEQLRAALTAFLVPQRAAKHDADAELLKHAMSTSLQVGGLRVPTWIWGQGPQVLLVHGWGSRASHLGAFVGPLVAAGFAVIGYDAPAHGDAPGDSSSVVHLGHAVRQVCRASGPIHALIAHSVGSPACLWAIRDGLKIRHTVHLAGPSTLANVVAGFAKAFKLDETQTQLFEFAIEVFTNEPIACGSVAALAKGLKHAGLIVHDTEDREVPHTESAELNRLWPTSKLRLTHGLGHRRLLADANIVRDVVDFVAQNR